MSERDVAAGVEAPFCLVGDDGILDHGRVVKARATRCALSRICGVCGQSQGWPVAFVGTPAEADDEGFTFAPSHEACARAVLARWAGAGDGHLGQAVAPDHWVLLTTGGFDLERPASRVGDQRLRFRPNSVLERLEVPASGDAS